MTYSDFLIQVIKIDASMSQYYPEVKDLNDVDYKYAYIAYINYGVSVTDAVCLAMNFVNQTHVSDKKTRDYLMKITGRRF